MSPEELLKKLQSNPAAMSMMMEASSDPALLSALQANMKSPAELLKAGKLDGKVGDFLNRLWETLDLDPLEVQEPEQKEGGIAAIQAMAADFLGGGDKKGEGLKESVKEPVKEPVKEAEFVETQAVSPSTSSSPQSTLRPIVVKALEEEFKPEFLNRLDEIVVFTPLSRSELTAIATNLLTSIAAAAEKEKKVTLTFKDDLVTSIVDESEIKSRRYGARPLKRTVLRYVEDGLSDALVSGFLKSGNSASLGIVDDHLCVQREGGEMELYMIQPDDGEVGSAGEVGVRDEIVAGAATG